MPCALHPVFWARQQHQECPPVRRHKLDSREGLAQHLPNITLTFSSGALTLLPKAYLYRYTGNSRSIPTWCLAIMSNGAGSAVLGAVTMRDVVVTYDNNAGKEAVTFQAIDSCEKFADALSEAGQMPLPAPAPTPASDDAGLPGESTDHDARNAHSGAASVDNGHNEADAPDGAATEDSAGSDSSVGSGSAVGPGAANGGASSSSRASGASTQSAEDTASSGGRSDAAPAKESLLVCTPPCIRSVAD